MENGLFDYFLDLAIWDGGFGFEGIDSATGFEELDELGGW